MIETLRRGLAVAGGLRGIAAMLAVAWGIQELGALVEDRTQQLEQLAEAQRSAAAVWAEERRIWQETNRRTTMTEAAARVAAAVPIVVDVVDVEVVEEAPAANLPAGEASTDPLERELTGDSSVPLGHVVP